VSLYNYARSNKILFLISGLIYDNRLHTAPGMAEYIASYADEELAARIQKVIKILKKAGAK